MTMITETTKLCKDCGLVKELEAFSPHPSGTGKVNRSCKLCRTTRANARYAAKKAADPEGYADVRRDQQYQKKYGITLEDFNKLLSLQNGECAICRRTGEESGGRGKILHVDHNHDTNEVRGLLCHPCNTAIGLLQDSPKVTRAALEYMETQGHCGE